RRLPLEAQLTALLDGEVAPEQRHELEQRLASDENARRLQEKLRHGADFGRRRLGDILKEPVPLARVRSIKSTQPPKT
ncbi:anti-sigma factor, partial [Rhizobium ruizarguesonis]